MKMRDMVVMKHAVANLLLKLAVTMGAEKSEDRRLKTGDGLETSKPSSIPVAPAQAGLPSSPQIEAFLTAHPVWGVDEAKATAAFLSSLAGQLFSKRIRSVAAHVAIEGAKTGGTRCATTANTIHSAGVSAGWNECVRYIHSLGGSATCQLISRVSGDQDTRQADVRLPIDTNDRQPIEDESALLERLSP